MKNFEKFSNKQITNYGSNIYGGGDSHETIETSGPCYTDQTIIYYDSDCNEAGRCTIKRTTCPQI